MDTMKFGIAFANIGPFIEPERACELARSAEAGRVRVDLDGRPHRGAAGYRSTYPYDPSGRLPSGEDAPFPDPLIWLAYVARATSTIRLATGILILPERNPVVLAKELATLDYLSSGRVTLGVGIGWLKEEFEAMGVPFDKRGQRTEESDRRHAGAVVGGPGQPSRGRRCGSGTSTCGPSPGRDHPRSISGVTARSPPDGPVGSVTGSSRSASTGMSWRACWGRCAGPPRRRAGTRRPSRSP